MKKAQIDNPIIAFFIIAVGLLILAPVMQKSYNAIYDGLEPQLATLPGGANVSATNFSAVMTPLINFWDGVILAAFIFSIILLFISSFLIDTHPVWVILYIMIAFMLVLFMPNIISSIDAIYDSPHYATEVTQLTFMDNIRTYFAEILLGLIVITGIIIYGKIKLFPSQQGLR